MKNKVIVIISVLLPLMAGSAGAQDRDTLQRLLRWFPCGETGRILIVEGEDFIEDYAEETVPGQKEIYEKYTIAEILHFDREKFDETCPRKVKDEYVVAGRKLLSTENHYVGWRFARFIPPSLDGRYESMTRASIAKLGIKLTEAVAEDGSIIRVNRKCAFGYQANGHYYCAWLPTRSLYVYRFADLDSLVRQALRKGELERLEEGLGFERPVFVYREPGSDKPVYAYAALSQELLMAEDLGDLVNMVNTGMLGGGDGLEFTDLSALMEISQNDFLWSYRNEVAMFELLQDYLREKDPDSPSTEEVEERLATGKQNIINEYRWDAGGAHSHLIIISYGDENEARSDYHRLLLSSDKNEFLVLNTIYVLGHAVSFKDTVRLLNDVREEIETELDENRLIISRTDDEEILLRMLEVLRKSKLKAEEK